MEVTALRKEETSSLELRVALPELETGLDCFAACRRADVRLLLGKIGPQN